MGFSLDDPKIDSCDFIDVLEEAATRRRPVEITLQDGSTFTDVVMDVVTENHADYVEFQSHPRVKVTELRACTRAESTADYTLDDVPL